MAKTLQERLSGTKEKLGRVRRILFKRRARVAHAKAMQALWRKRMERADKNGWSLKGTVAEKKLALWHQKLDQRLLGRKDYERREAALAKKLAYLREKKQQLHPDQYPDKIVVSDSPWNPSHLGLPGWIAEINDEVWKSGLRFTLVSGYRTKAYSVSLCQHMCGRDSCPGTCAGLLTNHACPPTYTGREPEGAEDVSNQYEFAARLQRLGLWDRLKNDLPNDRVHFSRTGH